MVIFDEPVNGLDPDGVVWLRKLLQQLASEGRTVLLSSHLMSELERTAEDLVIIGRGRLIEQSTTKALAEHFGSLEDAYLALTGNDAEHSAMTAGGHQ